MSIKNVILLFSFTEPQCEVKRIYKDEGIHINRSVNPHGMAEYHHQKVSRQISEECNVQQSYSGDKRQKVDNNSSNKYYHYNGANTNYEAVHSKNIEMAAAKPDRSRLNGIDSIDNPSSHARADTSLSCLRELSNVPDRLKPTEDYKNIIMDQNVSRSLKGHNTL